MSDDLQKNYEGTFDGRLGFGSKPAVILVDLVQAYFEPDSPLYAGVESELESAIRIRDAARAAGVPVIYTNVVYEAGGSNGGVFYRKVPVLSVFDEGSPLGDWAPGLDPAENELVVSKQYPSAFFGTSLAESLDSMGIDTLIITGVTTSGCIRATCVDTMSHGFVPVIVADACGDRHEDPHNANLFDMQAKYADVVNESQAIEYLRSLG